MTRPSDHVANLQKGVVVFDICYSSAILEDLTRTENLVQWRNFLIRLKNYLQKNEIFEMYKFLGDGWILLFDPELEAIEILDELQKFSCYFRLNFDLGVKGYLEIEPPMFGITCGLDTGTLVKVEMDGKFEFIGRPLNVASRLQSALKDVDSDPRDNVLLPAHYFRKHASSLNKSPYTKHQVSLRNLSNDKEVTVYRLDLSRLKNTAQQSAAANP